MPELAQARAQSEQRLTQVLTSLGSEWRARIEPYLGYPPDVSRVPPGLWADMEFAYRQKLSREAAAIYLLALGRMSDETPEGYTVAEPLAAQFATQWTEKRAAITAQQFVTNTRERLVTLRRDLVIPKPGTTLPPAGDGGAALLDDLLGNAFGESRATTMAVTETTATISGGEAGFRKAYLDYSGHLLLAIWTTEEDDRVCPVCSPLHEKPQTEWPVEILMLGTLGPPAHPNCRCWLEYKLVTKEQMGV